MIIISENVSIFFVHTKSQVCVPIFTIKSRPQFLHNSAKLETYTCLSFLSTPPVYSPSLE